ncbi:hypothetical protein [Halobacillus litoralis]|uniref:hypothetical protein n=1 Tax=Halobacillus litoralis TaxID=45668 RepID=UPI000FFB4380|nr:hypothetical protein [Halobacillus litoralis]
MSYASNKEAELDDFIVQLGFFQWTRKSLFLDGALSGTARTENPLGQAIFLTRLAEAVPAANIH